jgi:phage baseplate assembly protein W
VATAAATDFGTDVDCRTGVPLRWGLVSGRANVVNAIARRFVTATGALPDDPAYGLDLRSYLNAGLTAAKLSQLRSSVVAQCELEPRIQSCDTVVFDFSFQASTLVITIGLTDAAGPFTLVLAVNDLTVAILNQGQTAAAALAAAPATETTAGGAPGRDGAPGPSGPPGPAGSGAGGIELSFPKTVATNTGSAEIIEQITVDFSGLTSSTVLIDLVGRALSTSGTATFRVYVGGSYDVIDGTLVGTATTTSGSLVEIQISSSITNPTGLRPVKIVATSGAAGQDARLSSYTVSIR